MATCFYKEAGLGWNGDSWALSSGGAIVPTLRPTIADDALVDANSNATACSIALTGAWACKNLTVTAPGTSGAFTFTGTGAGTVAGVPDIAASVVWSHTGNISYTSTAGGTFLFRCTCAANTITTGTGHTWTLGANFTSTKGWEEEANGTLNDGGFTFSVEHLITDFTNIVIQTTTWTITGTGADRLYVGNATTWNSASKLKIVNTSNGSTIGCRMGFNTTIGWLEIANTGTGGVVFTRTHTLTKLTLNSAVNCELNWSNSVVTIGAGGISNLSASSVVYTFSGSTGATMVASGAPDSVDLKGSANVINTLPISGAAVPHAYAGPGSSYVGAGAPNGWTLSAAPSTARQQQQGASYFS